MQLKQQSLHNGAHPRPLTSLLLKEPYLEINWNNISSEISFDPWEELGPILPRYGFSAEFIWHHAAIDLFHEVFKGGSNQ